MMDGNGASMSQESQTLSESTLQTNTLVKFLIQIPLVQALTNSADQSAYQLGRYGEKIVKGSPNPRSYYKCSHSGCCAKKIVERNSHGEILATEYKVRFS